MSSTDKHGQQQNKLKLRQFFEERGQRVTCQKGGMLLMPMDAPENVYFIERGYVKVYWLTEEGNEKFHVVYKPGEFFPLMWALNDEAVGGYYAAMDEVVCRRVSKQDLLAFLKANPDVMLSVVEELANIFKIYVSQVDNLVITKAYPRVISRLLFLATRFGREEDGAIEIEAPMTHSDIASSIALTRETVNRAIHKLEKKHLVTIRKQHLVILDRASLEAELAASFD